MGGSEEEERREGEEFHRSITENAQRTKPWNDDSEHHQQQVFHSKLEFFVHQKWRNFFYRFV